MTGWPTYDYLIASKPHACVFDDLSAALTTRTIMEPRRLSIVITDANAILIVMDDVGGLRTTRQTGLFDFDGDRPMFDGWMTDNHPDIAYIWIDQFCVAVADHAAKLKLDRRLGSRVIRAAPLTV